MMTDLEILILKKLMISYNKSMHSKLGGESKRRVAYTLETFDMTIYDPSDSDSLAVMNEAVYALAQENLITFEKNKFNENYITKVYMNLEAVDIISNITGIKNNKAILSNIYDFLNLNYTEEKCDWIKSLLHDELDLIIKKSQLLFFPKDIKLIDGILRVLETISKEEGFYIRTLSTQLFSDSKFIEKNLLSNVIKIIKCYHPDIYDVMEKDALGDNELLRRIGVFTYEEIFEFIGDCKAIYNNQILNFSAYDNGVYIGSDTASKITSINLKNINVITLIENKMNYVNYCKKEKKADELVIFSGGYFSIQRKKFYEVLQNGMVKNQTIRLWSDIDLGGFQMFHKLNCIFENLIPMRMNTDIYLNGIKFARTMSDSYFERVKSLLVKDGYEIFQDVIQEILIHRCVLEQESFYLNDIID